MQVNYHKKIKLTLFLKGMGTFYLNDPFGSIFIDFLPIYLQADYSDPFVSTTNHRRASQRPSYAGKLSKKNLKTSFHNPTSLIDYQYKS